MKRVALAVALLLGVASAARATIITADPDSFAAGTDLTLAFPGVTLTVDGPGYPSSGPVVSATAGAFIATTGTRIFAHGPALPEYWREAGFLNLRVAFTNPVRWVAIDVSSDDASDFGHLRAFSPGGILLGSFTTSQLSTNQFATMSFAAPSIGYVLVGGLDGGSAVGLDNLQYEPVPEPGTILLLGAGIVGLAARRRRERA